MDIIRYIFFILILMSSTSIGFILSKRFIDREEELNCLLKYITILQNQIKFTHKPLNDIFEEISKLGTNKQLSEVFNIVRTKLKTKSMEIAWQESIAEKKDFLNLKKEDIALIKTLGNVLRKNRYRRTNE